MYSEENLPQALKKAREEAGLTQKEVEAKLEMRALTMRDYEVGRLKLPLNVAIELAKLYGVSLEELSGLAPHPHETTPDQTLANFTAIFAGSSYQLMLMDPILRAFFEDRHDDFFDQSLFDVLTQALSGKDKKALLLDIGRLLFALAAADGKISDAEIKTIRYVLAHFQMSKAYREVSQTVSGEFSWPKLPTYMESIEVRHFLVWLQFLFASVNQKISPDEVNFIAKRAEELRLNRTNFLFIQGHFIKEDL